MFVRFYYMNHAIETELKVLLSREQFNRLASFYQPLTFVRQINTYYKNNNSDHYAFRIREKEGTLLFTLKNKTPEGVFRDFFMFGDTLSGKCCLNIRSNQHY